MDWRVVPRSLFVWTTTALNAVTNGVLAAVGSRDPLSPPRILVDQVDAATRDVYARITGDRVVADDAALRREAVNERKHALRLRLEAKSTIEDADSRLEDELGNARRKAEEARSIEQDKLREARAKESARERGAGEAAQQLHEAAENVAAERRAAARSKARAERLESLQERASALDEAELALTADDEAARLERAAQETKQRRKASGH